MSTKRSKIANLAVLLTLVVAGMLAPSVAGAGQTAPGLLSKLPVAAEKPAGYDRDLFNHWITVPGRDCDVRDFVLFRQNQQRPRVCGAETGLWTSAYDGTKLRRSSQLDIDHMVPLAEAWGSGARSWKPQQREAFANDLYPRSLIAVSLSSNRSKGDSDPAEWLPRAAYICRYVANWTAVKYRWRLTVDSREKRTLSQRFSRCPKSSLRLPTIKRAQVPASQGGGGNPGKTDPRFATCTAAIAAGYGPYRKGIDPEYEWYTDGDGDGTVCEK